MPPHLRPHIHVSQTLYRTHHRTRTRTRTHTAADALEGEVVLVDQRVLGQRDHDGRHQRRVGDPVLFQNAQKFLVRYLGG
jgi:hypothetical protein